MFTFNDSDFTWDKFDAAYSGELANDLGNLVQRLAVLDSKNDVTINYEKVAEDFSEYYQLMDSFEFSKAFDYAWSKIKDLNKDINDAEPWKVAKADSEKAKEILEKLTVRLLNYTELLKPFLTDTSKKIFDIFQNPITIPNPLFPKA